MRYKQPTSINTMAELDRLLASGNFILVRTSLSKNSAISSTKVSQSWQGELSAALEKVDHKRSEASVSDFVGDIPARHRVYKDCILCRTRNMHGQEDFARVPVGAQVGDQLCIFENCPDPHLVRDAGDEVYSLIGDA